MSDIAKLKDSGRVLRSPHDDGVAVGDWYWVMTDDREWNKEKEEYVHFQREVLMCVEHIGSNYVGFKIHSERNSTSHERIHFDEFFKVCRREDNWQAILQHRLDETRKAIAEKTRLLVEKGRELCLLRDEQPEPSPNDSFLPAVASVDLQGHKKKLVALKDSLPEIQKEIKELGEQCSTEAHNLLLPEMVKMEDVVGRLDEVKDHIFTVELYCGLREQVKQIADGTPADINEPIAVRQLMLFMDEESLIDYAEGGLDFQKLDQFDEWVVKPANLNRILPEQRGIVAFQVRRHKKDRGQPTSLFEAFVQMKYEEFDMATYLLIRNGQKVYRIASDVDFSPRLIPLEDEIGEAQFLEHAPWYASEKEKEKPPKVIGPDSVRFDDHVEELESKLRHYNHIVILLQGLLDRSEVFKPHPVINLIRTADMDRFVRLIRDEEKGLPNNKVDWDEYRRLINSGLKKGCWVLIDRHEPHIAEREYAYERRHSSPKRGYWANPMPQKCEVEAVSRDKTKVKVTWPRGKTLGRWVYHPEDGKDHWENESKQMCHEWVEAKYVFNASAYTPGDFKMFLCDHALKGRYEEWAWFLLCSEDFQRRRLSGKPPEEE